MMMMPGGGMPGMGGGGPPKKTKNAGFFRRIYEDEFQVSFSLSEPEGTFVTCDFTVSVVTGQVSPDVWHWSVRCKRNDWIRPHGPALDPTRRVIYCHSTFSL